jgi:hypothetical protein
MNVFVQNLVELDLSFNLLGGIEGIERCHRLRVIRLHSNRIITVTPLASLKQLRR